MAYKLRIKKILPCKRKTNLVTLDDDIEQQTFAQFNFKEVVTVVSDQNPDGLAQDPITGLYKLQFISKMSNEWSTIGFNLRLMPPSHFCYTYIFTLNSSNISSVNIYYDTRNPQLIGTISNQLIIVFNNQDGILYPPSPLYIETQDKGYNSSDLSGTLSIQRIPLPYYNVKFDYTVIGDLNPYYYCTMDNPPFSDITCSITYNLKVYNLPPESGDTLIAYYKDEDDEWIPITDTWIVETDPEGKSVYTYQGTQSNVDDGNFHGYVDNPLKMKVEFKSQNVLFSLLSQGIGGGTHAKIDGSGTVSMYPDNVPIVSFC